MPNSESLFELHVWCPGFSLPSIDPHCLAAVAYLTQILPQDRWTLIQDSLLALDVEKVPPVLKYGQSQISGFKDIVRFLREHSHGRWDLDVGLTNVEKATVEAFSSMLESNGRPLLDLSLFVSSDNYNERTKPALSGCYPWPLNLSISHQLRSCAEQRTEHLGITDLSLNPGGDGTSSALIAASTAGIPSSFLKIPKSDVLGQIKKTQQFRLRRLVGEFAAPLQALLASKRFLISEDQPTSLDCLAVGYLQVACIRELPLSWLADALRTEFETLCTYMDDYLCQYSASLNWKSSSHRHTESQTPERLSSRAAGGRYPSFQLHPQNNSLLRRTSMPVLLFNRTMVALPLAKHHRAAVRLSGTLLEDEDDYYSQASRQYRVAWGVLFAAAAAGLCFGSYLFNVMFSTPQQGSSITRRSDFGSLGEAGAAHAVFSSETAQR